MYIVLVLYKPSIALERSVENDALERKISRLSSPWHLWSCPCHSLATTDPGTAQLHVRYVRDEKRRPHAKNCWKWFKLACAIAPLLDRVHFCGAFSELGMLSTRVTYTYSCIRATCARWRRVDMMVIDSRARKRVNHASKLPLLLYQARQDSLADICLESTFHKSLSMCAKFHGVLACGCCRIA